MAFQTPTVIIGWGLAGATMAWQMHFRKTAFTIHDSGINHATRTAAGIANPVVFKKLTQSWNAELLMPYAEDFYKKIESILGIKLISGKNIYYPFTNKEDENNWSVKMGDSRFSDFIEHTSLKPFDHVQMPHGMGKVNTFGNLDTAAFLDHSKAYFEKQGVVFATGIVDSHIALQQPDTNYIFCEGAALMQNPLFAYLPMKAAHGEVLIIESDELNFEDVVSKNLFILPLGNNRFKVGATYNWELKEPVTTDLGKADLIERFENLVDCSYKIIDHQAGIRPTVADRRPLLGVHPEQKNAFVFNGLGTKGVMLAPYYAAHFLDFYLNGKSLEAEVNITRFQRRFTKS